MKGELDNHHYYNESTSQQAESEEPEVEIWSEEDLKLRTAQLQKEHHSLIKDDAGGEIVYVHLSRSIDLRILHLGDI